MKNIFKIALLVGLFAILVLAVNVFAAKNNSNEKITICHATGSETNPYVEITISINGWLNGHSDHNGDFISPYPGYDCSLGPVPPSCPPVYPD